MPQDESHIVVTYSICTMLLTCPLCDVYRDKRSQ